MKRIAKNISGFSHITVLFKIPDSMLKKKYTSYIQKWFGT